MNIISEIEKWFQQQCNGEWEHSKGIKIETCDNPGWWVIINIDGTVLENKLFEMVVKNVPNELIDHALGRVKIPYISAKSSSDNWLICYVKDNEFNGVGDPTKLHEILRTFLDWTNQ